MRGLATSPSDRPVLAFSVLMHNICAYKRINSRDARHLLIRKDEHEFVAQLSLAQAGGEAGHSALRPGGGRDRPAQEQATLAEGPTILIPWRD